MSPATTARALAGLNVQRGRPTAAQWIDALAILANTTRTPGRSLHVAFTPGGSAKITEIELPKVAT